MDDNLPLHCVRCRELIDRHLLGLLDAEEADAMRQHLVQCESCRREAQAGADLVAAVGRTLGPQPGDAALLARVAVQAEQEACAGNAQSGRPRLVLAAAAAAAVVLGVGVVLCLPVSSSDHRGVESGGPETGYSWRIPGVRSCCTADVAYPVVCGRTLLAFQGVATGKRLIAVDGATGGLLWRTEFDVTGCSLAADLAHAFTWRPAAGGGQNLVALDLANGQIVWERAARDRGDTAAGAILVLAGNALCWTAANQVVAVDAGQGTPLWSVKLDRAGMLSVPAADGAAVFVASGLGLWALASDSGHVLWQVPYAGSRLQPIPPAVYCDGQKVVVATGRFTARGFLRCHDPRTGQLRWGRDVAAPVHSLTLAGDVYVRCGKIRAFSGATGDPLWSAALDGCSPVVAWQQRLYTTEGQGHASLVALDIRTGTRVWQRHLADSCSGLVVARRMGYLASRDGSLYALDTRWSG
ncbi:MAG: hypothetical protein A3K19_11140 [Lentisphaerae bacterium RIFOXYB12_FULL_65_16]|nr:MAG: hypothetical protein A3K18_25700 [Lentisphaerae bacterium RIFOXYA12_64_32]OGV90788.1 MAG: hypothetical protein A3K19_11140 [Lentisphaerae bacterium RIFOXYB12_FULL_65_16]